MSIASENNAMIATLAAAPNKTLPLSVAWWMPTGTRNSSCWLNPSVDTSCVGMGGRKGVYVEYRNRRFMLFAKHLSGYAVPITTPFNSYFVTMAGKQIVVPHVINPQGRYDYSCSTVDLSISYFADLIPGVVPAKLCEEVLPSGTPAVFVDQETKALIRTIGAAVDSVTTRHSNSTTYPTKTETLINGDSSGAIFALSNNGIRVCGCNNQAGYFVPVWGAKAKAELDACVDQLPQIAGTMPPAYVPVITPQQVADAANAAGLNTVEKLTAALKKVAI